MKMIALGLAALIAFPATANAATFFNGSFEDGTAPGSFTTVSAGGTAIDGWTVLSGTVDYIGTYWQPGNGARSLDLNGGSAGAIAQTFDTIQGVTYFVDFLMAGNPDGAPVLKGLEVAATGNNAATFNFSTAGTSKGAMGWESMRYAFTATGTSTTLSFASLDSGAYGAALDGINVTAVPEPASWAMMIGGLALVGAAMRRSKAVVRFA